MYLIRQDEPPTESVSTHEKQEHINRTCSPLECYYCQHFEKTLARIDARYDGKSCESHTWWWCSLFRAARIAVWIGSWNHLGKGDGESRMAWWISLHVVTLVTLHFTLEIDCNWEWQYESIWTAHNNANHLNKDANEMKACYEFKMNPRRKLTKRMNPYNQTSWITSPPKSRLWFLQNHWNEKLTLLSDVFEDKRGHRETKLQFRK